MRILPTLALTAAALGLAACGTTESDRALSGAAIGAGAGALTDADDINLGEPLWRR